MKKILFLYCGGTIGQMPQKRMISGVERDILCPPDDASSFENACQSILKEVKETSDMDIHFEVFTTKDSSNMQPQDWQAIAERIQRAQDDESYQAVGIAHGTDTMAYTSTALALALHGSDPEKSGLAIPVVLTGSQNSIHVQGGDGAFNLQNMFRVIDTCINAQVADVLLSFWSRVLLGSRVVKVSERDFDAFRTPGYPDVGTINSFGVTVRSDLTKQRSDASYRMWLAPAFSEEVISFDIVPGLKPEVVMKALEGQKVKAVILKSLAGGHIPTEGDYSFADFIRTLTEEKDLPVIISTRFINGFVGSSPYEVGVAAIEAGGIPGLDHTSVAVEVKTRWLVANEVCSSVEGFQKAFSTSFAGEVTL